MILKELGDDMGAVGTLYHIGKQEGWRLWHIKLAQTGMCCTILYKHTSLDRSRTR